MALKVGELYGELDVRGDLFDRKVDAAGKKWGDLGDKMTSAGQKMSLGVTLPTLAVLGMSVKAASSLNETRNKAAVVFGSAAADIAKFAESAASNLAMSEQAALEGAAGFGNLFNTTGIAEGASEDMSESLLTLAADMASFNDQSPEEMLEKLRAGLVGEAEPLRTVGVLLSEARVQEEAYTSGIAKRGEDLTEAQKVQARYNLILEDTAKQQGDLDRTSDSLSNQLKTLKAVSTDAAAGFGEVLVPAVTPAVELLGKGVDILQKMPDGLKKVVVGVGLVAAALGPLLVVTGSVLKGFQRIRDFRFRKLAAGTPAAGGEGAAAGEVGTLGRASALAAQEVATLGRAAAIASGKTGLTPAGKRGANLMNQGAAAQMTKKTGTQIERMGTKAQVAAPQLTRVGTYAGRASGRLGRLTTAIGSSTAGSIAGMIGLGLALDFTIPKVIEAGDAFMQWMDALGQAQEAREGRMSTRDAFHEKIVAKYGSEQGYLDYLAKTYGKDSTQYKNALSALQIGGSGGGTQVVAGKGYSIPIKPRALGGDDIVSRPTLFLAGEGGRERATFTPEGQPGFSDTTGRGKVVKVDVTVHAGFIAMPNQQEVRKLTKLIGDDLSDMLYNAGGG